MSVGRSSLIQAMACRLFDAMPLPKPMITYYLPDKLKSNLNWNTQTFFQENAFENIVYHAKVGRFVQISDALRNQTWTPGACLNIKMSPYRYKDPRVKDKTVSRPSYL